MGTGATLASHPSTNAVNLCHMFSIISDFKWSHLANVTC